MMDSLQPRSNTMENVTSRYKYMFTDLADLRTNDWFLMSSPIPITIILLSYLYFVKICGPNYMKDKEPYKLKRVIRIYNLLQIAANVWIFKEAVSLWSGYNFNCQPVDYSNSPAGMKAAWCCYMYLLNKISDVLETFFFVLRKKNRQISFLHVFHHTLMIFGTWNVVKYFPGGHGSFIILANSFVHILLYSYYYLAALGPKIQKYLWWKKYLTRIQLIQFCLVFLHSCQLLVLECDYPTGTVLFTLPNSIFFFYLFYDFYKKTYRKAKGEPNNVNTEKVKAT